MHVFEDRQSENVNLEEELGLVHANIASLLFSEDLINSDLYDVLVFIFWLNFLYLHIYRIYCSFKVHL